MLRSALTGRRRNGSQILHWLLPSATVHPLLPAQPHFLSLTTLFGIMPTCRRKRVMLKELTSALIEEAQKDPSSPVFYMEQTGEIFTDYEYVSFSLPLT